MKVSEYYKIGFSIPESHAKAVRDAIHAAGGGSIGNYSYADFSIKGIGRFMPHEGANPHIGEVGILEEVVEERIETVCRVSLLEAVIEAIKKAHPYEETIIDIMPIYEMARKKGS